MSNPTRFLSGVATTPASQPLGNYPFPDPFHTGGTAGLDVVTYFNDYFDTGTTTNYTIAGAGAALALGVGSAGVGGTLVFTPGSATASAVTRAATAFQFIKGNKFWFIQRISASAVAGVMSMFFGLNTANAAITADGIYFRKAASQLNLDLISVINGTTTVLAAAITTTVAATYLDVAFYYDGTDLIVYVNDSTVAHISNVTVGATNAFTLTNAYISPVIQITPVGTENLNTDYVLVAQEITR
jgi:hypothetical protein